MLNVWEGKMFLQVLVGKPELKGTLSRPRIRGDTNIKIGLTDIE
jgi:hypothetical protein